MTVLFECEIEEEFPFPIEEMITQTITFALDYMKCPFESEVSVTITDNEAIHRLNLEFREVDRATDVLSFPMIDFGQPCDYEWLENESEDCFSPDSGELLLGDIVISWDKVKEQAEQYGHSTKRELCFLVVHSVLHLLGYDHMEDNERFEMEHLQEDILSHQGIRRE